MEKMQKIALFIGGITGEYQAEMALGIAEAAMQEHVQLETFVNTGYYGDNVFYKYGEKNIINLPALEDYDGIIIAPETFGIKGMYEELTELVDKKANCPVVCLRYSDEKYYCINIDDYVAMYNMVEHFVTVHGCKRICFMTGKLTMQDAQRRLRAYQDVMKKYGLPVTDRMIFEGDYWKTKGEEAVSWFLDDAEEMPEAIVCANDYMAISVNDALVERGIETPKDILVAGYDDVEEARFSIPSITSMHAPNKEIGKKAIQIIKNVNRNKKQERDVYINAKPCFRGTCGCKKKVDSKANRMLLAQKERQQTLAYRNFYLDIDADNDNSFEELIDTLYLCGRDYGFEEVYICFCDEEEKQVEEAEMQGKYTEQMVLRAVMNKKDYVICNRKFPRRDILPKEYLSDGIPAFIYPVHEKSTCLGYVVFKAASRELVSHFYGPWIARLSNAYERIKMYSESKDMKEMRQQYYKDELTGIGNRRAMDKVFRRRTEIMGREGKGFCVVSIDMDGLKYINDTFGHMEGDCALRKLAEILDQEKGANGDVARMGGDEYWLCVGTEDEIEVRQMLASIREKIGTYNLNSGREWQLSASIGYAFCVTGTDLMTCLDEADKKMYAEKRGKKTSRRGTEEK